MSTASTKAYERIRAFLLAGKARPGDKLTEEQFSDIAGVSRTPVREAVQRLERELLLKRTKTNRIVVPDWSGNEIEEMFTLRQMLESHAAERAADRITHQQLSDLAEINALLKEAVEREPPDMTRFLDANRSFHEKVTEAAQSPRLAQILASLVEQPVVLHTAQVYSMEDLKQSARDHEELISAFRARDPAWARSIMGAHLRRAFHAFADAMRDQHGQGAADA